MLHFLFQTARSQKAERLDIMMTFKDLKKLVELPSYKEQRVPTVKALEVSGVPVVAEKILENHGSISVYQNGYVIYRANKRVTVFSLRNCVHYKYDR